MSRAKVGEIARASLARGDALGWFDAVYDAASGDTNAVPWADLAPNPMLVDWLAQHGFAGQRVLVVGAGLGDDAELFASKGADVTAFDLSPKAIAWAKERWPTTRVDYLVADLLAMPDAWRGAYDFVFEAYTLQSLPPGSELRARALDVLAPLLASDGVLLIVARGKDEMPAMDQGPPWPLVRAEIDRAGAGLAPLSFDDLDDGGTRRFVAAYSKMVFAHMPSTSGRPVT